MAYLLLNSCEKNKIMWHMKKCPHDVGKSDWKKKKIVQMRGEKQLIEQILQTEINLFRSIRDGTALMQHMEDFYYITLLEVFLPIFSLMPDDFNYASEWSNWECFTYIFQDCQINSSFSKLLDLISFPNCNRIPFGCIVSLNEGKVSTWLNHLIWEMGSHHDKQKCSIVIGSFIFS